eukprot:m51a1_g3997 hypothetical protein (417) ;mRNA; r:514233-515704
MSGHWSRGKPFVPPPAITFGAHLVAGVSVELARANCPVEIAVAVLPLAGGDPETALFHALVRGERVGRAEQFRHGILGPDATAQERGGAAERWMTPVEAGEELRKFCQRYCADVEFASEQSRDVYAALRRSLFFGNRVPFYVHDLTSVARKAFEDARPRAGPPASFSALYEDELGSCDACAYHAARDPSFHCAAARARAVARSIRRCWRAEVRGAEMPPVPRPPKRNALLSLPSTLGEADGAVLMTAAARGEEFAACTFVLSRGEVAQFSAPLPDERDARACASFFEVLRALSSYPRCLVTTPGDAEILSKALSRREEAAGPQCEAWRPYFLVIEPGEIRSDKHGGRRFREDLEEHTRRTVDGASHLCCRAHAQGPTRCALAAARAVAISIRTVFASLFDKEGSRRLEEAPLTLRC